MASTNSQQPIATAVTVEDVEKGVLQMEIDSDSAWDSNTSNTSLLEEEEWIYPHPTDFKLTDAPIDEVREVKVAVIGAGVTGITAGILLPAKVPRINLTILEKNDDVVSTSLTV